MSVSMFDEVLPRGERDGVGLRVGAIIDREGDVLLLEPHSSGPIRPTLKLPGATVEAGESVTGALVRGVLEETGLVVTGVGHHVGDFDYLSPAGRPVRRLHFAVQVAATAPVVLSAHARYVWAPLSDDLHVTSSIHGILDTYRDIVHR
ncbi:ADP-ribose pyrophosphatase YjhB (NUDIX family) [Nocardia transvalensis]|uniref:ADP-ribose pyrophosphatase YjhB (NUDIX family) n=1 Tax=Nocardia transvalensis TaxID=37333 RepID=A0A7W9UFW2_9NOCA|nr:NUDIX hydrolase [Nocardia transvalensis]MBB5911537.1 ADP-ribose pyrophosphatase YjhB (NUDIX family) [Nocardia transvalensis]